MCMSAAPLASCEADVVGRERERERERRKNASEQSKKEKRKKEEVEDFAEMPFSLVFGPLSAGSYPFLLPEREAMALIEG